MASERRWAALYHFTRDLWQERDRILVGQDVQQWARGQGFGPGLARDLIDALLPMRPTGQDVWVAGRDDQAASVRAGSACIELRDAGEVARRGQWQAAVVELPAEVIDESSRSDPWLGLVDALSERAGTNVVLAVRCERPGDGSEDFHERFVRFVDAFFPDLRHYGMAHSHFCAFYEFGGEEDDSAEVEIDYDNELAPREPVFEGYVAISARAPLPKGLTLVELSDTVAAPSVDARSAPVIPSGPRMDLVQAQAQALKWEVERLRGELERLRARPVQDLEAELARLRGAASVVPDGDENTDVFAATEPQPPPDGKKRTLPRQKLGRQLEALIHRVERGGISAQELHRDLLALRKRLLTHAAD